KELNADRPIDCSDLAQIDKYYALLYLNSAGDNPPLVDAIKKRNFHKVAEEYRLIRKGGANVVVPYGPEQAVYETVRDAIGTTGLTPGLMKQA
ncbi:MAG: hypothetical protein RR949_04360, partial [Oscillospiraceae bacterium]